MDDESLFSVIARVRRAMPRNADVMRICDAAERSAVAVGIAKVSLRRGANKFDKTAYQRDYMRKRRAEKNRR